MKAIIDRKQYNTETAELVADYSNGLGGGDFNHVREALYRTPKGRYFLHGKGGSMSSWAVRHADNGSSGGEGLRSVSNALAYEWAERCLDPGEVLEIFPDMVEDA